MSEQPAAPSQGPSFLNWMGSLWGYTLLRFGMFFALWGIMLLLGVGGFLAPLVAIVISVPLSLFLLAGPRRRVANTIEQRVEAARTSRQAFDTELDPDAHDEDG